MLYTCVSYFTYYLLFFYLKGGGPTKKSKIDNGEKEGEEDDKEIGEADKEKAGEKEEEEKEKETKMETEEQQPPPAAAADKQEEETDEKKKMSEEEESKQDAQPMDAQQEVKQVSIHHTHFAFCVSRNAVCYCNVGVACYKVGRLILLLLCGKYSTSSTVSVHMRPLYSICTSILPTCCFLSTGSRHICVHGTCIPSYVHCIGASIVLVLRPLSCFCTIVRQLHM